MLKQFGFAITAMTLTACVGGDPIDPAIGAIGDWNCKVRTIVDGKAHAQTFNMNLTEDRKAVLVSHRSYKEPGVALKYEQTSVGEWKTGGMRFGLDNLTHSIKVLRASGRTMRAMSEGQHASFARSTLRDSLKPTPKLRYEIVTIETGRFKLIEGDPEDPNAVQTNCMRVKELTEEQIAAAEAKAAEKDEGPQNTRSGLYN